MGKSQKRNLHLRSLRRVISRFSFLKSTNSLYLTKSSNAPPLGNPLGSNALGIMGNYNLWNALLSRAAKRRVTSRSFPSATVGDMKHYLQPSLKLKPSEIVLHVGTNDIKDHSSRVVAEQILDLGNLISSS